MRRCGEVRVVRSGGYVGLEILRDLLAFLLCLGFVGLLVFLPGGS